jgi:hypothetical protein
MLDHIGTCCAASLPYLQRQWPLLENRVTLLARQRLTRLDSPMHCMETCGIEFVEASFIWMLRTGMLFVTAYFDMGRTPVVGDMAGSC